MPTLDLAGGAEDDVTPPDSDSPPAPKAPHMPHVADALPPDSDSPAAPGPGLWARIKAHPTWIAIAIAAAGLVVTYLIWQQQTANGTAGTVTAVPSTATNTTTPLDTSTGSSATGVSPFNTDPTVLAELAALEAEVTALQNGGSSGTVTPPPLPPAQQGPPNVFPVPGGVFQGPVRLPPAQRPPGYKPPKPSPGPLPPAQLPPTLPPTPKPPAKLPPAAKGASLPHPNRLRGDG